MSQPGRPVSEVYKFPKYYALGYRWNTKTECDFLERCLREHTVKGKRVLDLGCGAGRHLFELAERGYRVSGMDLSPEMVSFVADAAQTLGVSVDVRVGDLHDVTVPGTFDLAMCLMDTFRFLLSNEDIVRHLRQVGERLAPGGLYVTDFWIPRQYDQIGNEVHQWEQTEGQTTVRVFYLQHPDTVDPVNQTFEDELVFEVVEGGETKEIRGGPTATRLLLPQEFRALVDASGVFTMAGAFSEFDVEKPLEPAFATWRMISVLKKRA